MLEQELKSIWRNSSKTEEIKFDLSQLFIELNYKMKTIQTTIQKRDRREIGASLIGIPIHVYLLFEIPYPITRVGLALIVGWFLFVIYKLRSARKIESAIDMASSIEQQLASRRSYLNSQANLLETAIYWYFIPPFVFNIICILGTENAIDYSWTGWLADLLPYTVEDKMFTIAMLFIFYAALAIMNKRAAKQNIYPILKDLGTVESQISAVGKDSSFS